MKQVESLRRDIHEALKSVVIPAPRLSDKVVARLHAEPAPSRRPATSIFQGAAVLAAAALVALIAFSLHQSLRIAEGPKPPRSSAIPNPLALGSNVAWLQGQNGYVGVDTQGYVVGAIEAPAMLRSADGSQLYGISDRYVNVYSAESGKLERQIPRVGRGLDGNLSPDGRYLVLVGARIEVIDLKAGGSAGVGALDSALRESGSGAIGEPIIVLPAANASRIYVFANFWTSPTMAIASFDPATQPSIRLAGQVHAGQPGHQLPSCDGMQSVGGASAPVRLLPDGKTIVSFCPGDGIVSWFDLNRLTITKQLTVPHENPFWVSPVFSRDGSTLVLHEGGTGRIEVIDLQQRTIVHSTTLRASVSFNLSGWLADRLFPPAYAGGIPRSAVLSPDGTRLYVVSIFGYPGGLWSVQLPSLRVLSQKDVPDSGGSIWLSGDGTTIYLLNNGGTELAVLHADGSQVATIQLPNTGYDFLQ